MKRKLALILGVIFAVILSAFAFTACDAGVKPKDPDNGGITDGDNQGGDNSGDNQGGTQTPTDTYTLTLAKSNINIVLSKDGDNTDSIGITVKKNGENFDGATVTCTSKNTAVAEVTDAGVVTGKAQGNTEITVKAEIDGQTPLTKLVNVSVSVPPTSRNLDNSVKTVMGRPNNLALSDVEGEEVQVYQINGGAVSFTSEQLAAMDTNFAAGYTYLTFDIKFPTAVSEKITANLGGTELIFRNDCVPSGGYYYTEYECTFGGNGLSLANLPKSYVDKADATEPAFLIYDASGNAVVNVGCRNAMTNGGRCYGQIGGVRDGKMNAGEWYTVIVPLANRTEAFATAGLSFDGFNGDYIKNIKTQSANPYNSNIVELKGTLFEAQHSSNADLGGKELYENIERLVWYQNGSSYPDVPEWASSWGASSTYMTKPISIDNGNSDSYDIAALIADGKIKEPTNQEGCFAGQHFFQLDIVPEMLNQGTTVVRFDIVFNSVTKLTQGYSGHTVPTSKTGYNFFAYVNGSWSYLNINTGGSYNRAKIWNAGNLVIYDGENQIILDAWGSSLDNKDNTINGVSQKGIKLGSKYTFEFNVSAGNSAKNHLLFCGVDGAVISNIVWSNKRLNESADEVQTESVSNLTVAYPVEHTVVGTASQFANAYEAGYEYVVIPVTLGTSVPEDLRISVYGNEMSIKDKWNEYVVCVKSVDGVWQPVEAYSSLEADGEYIFIVALGAMLSEEESVDFEVNGTVELQDGFTDATIGSSLIVNEDYAPLKALIESLPSEPDPAE